MLEVVASRTIPGCSEALAAVGLEDLVRLFADQFDGVEKLSFKRDALEAVFVYRPDEFTKKKIKTRFQASRREPNELAVEAKGKLNADLVIRCTGNEAVVAIDVHGKSEKMFSREKLEALANAVLDLLESKAPQRPQEPGIGEVAATPTQQATTTPALPTPAPAAGSRGEEFSEAMCIVKLITAGFPVDEDLSRRVKIDYSPRIGALPYVRGGVEPIERLDLIEYDDGYVIRLVSGDARVDVVRLGGRVGVYYRGPDGEAFGEEAVARAAKSLCKPGTRVAFTVVRAA